MKRSVSNSYDVIVRYFRILFLFVTISVLCLALQVSQGRVDAKAPPEGARFASGYVDISSGYRHTCGVKRDGSVSCWGYNESRELGIRSANYVQVALPIKGLTGAVAVSAGEKHSCALLATTQVKCWGANGSGQLGDATFETTEIPVTVTKSDGSPLTGVVQISAGNGFTCARLETGRVTCWGNAFALGDGTEDDRGYAGSEIPLTSVASLSAAPYGTRSVCAVTTSGDVYCWGADFNSTLKIALPTKKVGISSATSVLTADRHACALLTDESLRCWGPGFYGELGSTQYSEGIFGVSGLSVKTLARGGGYRTCVITHDDAARCWGQGWNGGLGTGSTTDRSSPAAVKIDRSTELSGVSMITVGESQTCALTAGGEVYCWGFSGYTARPWAEWGNDETSYAGRIAENPAPQLSGVEVAFRGADPAAPTEPSASFKTNLQYCDAANISVSAKVGIESDLSDGRTTSTVSATCEGGTLVLKGLTKPGQRYFYRLAMTSAYGDFQDEIRSFVARGKKPLLTVLPVSTISESAAKVVIGYDGDGLTATLKGGSCELSKSATFATSDSRAVTTEGTTCIFSNLDPETTYYFRGTISNDAGSTTTDSISFTTRKRSGISINGGDLYTKSANVKLTIVVPQVKEGSAVLVSNDGGFAKSETVTRGSDFEMPWLLPSSGDERLPKTVYVRYTNAAGEPQTLTDDIILDTRPPVVSAVNATASQGGDGVTVQAARTRSSVGSTRLSVVAKDENSGLSSVQIRTSETSRPTVIQIPNPKAKSVVIRIKSSKAKVYVSVTDRAGNVSVWKSTLVKK